MISVQREEKKRDLMESDVGLQRIHLKYKVMSLCVFIFVEFFYIRDNCFDLAPMIYIFLKFSYNIGACSRRVSA